MDYWHGRHGATPFSAAPAVALVKPMDSTIGAQNPDHFSVAPSTAELLLTVAQQRGFTRYGESYAAAHLCEVARHFGYRSRLHRSASPPAPHGTDARGFRFHYVGCWMCECVVVWSGLRRSARCSI